MKPNEVSVDIVIAGGGAIGLWTMARLAREGFSCVLLENQVLGAGQTIGSQGIIHGGIKYALTGRASRASRHVSEMPRRWQDCFNGRGEIDLSSVRILSKDIYMWSTQDLLSQVAWLCASRVMRTRGEMVQSGSVAGFRSLAGGAKLYRIPEWIVDTKSLLTALAKEAGKAILKGEVERIGGSGTVEFRSVNGRALRFETKRVVLAAGVGNEMLLRRRDGVADSNRSAILMQRRPLHMVMIRSEQLPMFFGHCVTASTKPRVTITTHLDHQGRTVWYLGGQVAEKTVGMESREAIIWARKELVACLRWLDWSGGKMQWATRRWDRAEGLTPDGSRPDEPIIRADGAVLTIWPTKLVFAPRVADHVLGLLRRDGVQPSLARSGPDLTGLERPGIASLPWDQEGMSWIDDHSVTPA